MKKRIVYVSLLAVVLASTCLGFGSPAIHPVNALPLLQGTDGRDFLVWQRHFGVVPGQMLRITGALADVSGRGQQTLQCMVFDQNGDLVFQTTPQPLPPRGFLQEDVTFGNLALVAGDSVTGRKQVMVEVRVQRSRNAKFSNFIGSLELVDSDGKTAAHKTLLTQVAINGTSQ
jgi:hypothetical protein